MKSLFLLAALALIGATCGCNTTVVKKTDPATGAMLYGRNSRMFWTTGKASASVTNAGGMSLHFEIENSKADVEALRAVAEGVATGMAKGAAKGVVP